LSLSFVRVDCLNCWDSLRYCYLFYPLHFLNASIFLLVRLSRLCGFSAILLVFIPIQGSVQYIGHASRLVDRSLIADFWQQNCLLLDCCGGLYCLYLLKQRYLHGLLRSSHFLFRSLFFERWAEAEVLEEKAVVW
jgi:hypothetical protein